MASNRSFLAVLLLLLVARAGGRGAYPPWAWYAAWLA